MRPQLVILSTHFGTNFSGGCTTTCEIVQGLESEFSRVHVVTRELGQHTLNNLQWHRYRTAIDAIRILRQFDRQNTVFYADFYNAYWLSLLRIPFYFTYHDNWPELGRLSLKFRFQYLFYWSVYRWIFRTARHVIVVSEKKRQLLTPWCRKISLVRNGCTRPQHPLPTVTRNQVIMVGSIDERKYTKALELFASLPADPGFTVDVYGHTHDEDIARTLMSYPFVELKGFHSEIPYQRYHLLLHTSLMENLSIVWCESQLYLTPVLTFDVGAATEAINAETGRCIPPYDIEAMRQALISLTQTPMLIEDEPQHLKPYRWETATAHYRKILLELWPDSSRDSASPQSHEVTRQ